jgi:hypothetical protein
MISRIKNILLATFAFGLLAAPVAVVGTVSAQDTPQIDNSLCQGAELQFGSGADCEGQGEEAQSQVNDLIADIINIFSIVVGIVAVIMIIIGGFKYITSGGDSGNVTGAKNTILYAIIGLVIVALAQFIVKFVLSKATQVSS